MQYEHVLSGLIRRRAELAGEIGALAEQLGAKQADLAHIDGAIRIFDPSAAPERIKNRRPPGRKSDRFQRGDFSRSVLTTEASCGDGARLDSLREGDAQG